MGFTLAYHAGKWEKWRIISQKCVTQRRKGAGGAEFLGRSWKKPGVIMGFVDLGGIVGGGWAGACGLGYCTSV